MSRTVDVVTVFHCERNFQEHVALHAQLQSRADADFRFIPVDNRENNIGFAPACNIGAALGESPIIGFINPDCEVRGPFIGKVGEVLADPGVVITGCRFGKPDHELRIWGVHDWVCGAAMFVRRSWWEEAGGFDEQFVWGWEETDLIRRAQRAGVKCRSIDLPIRHSSPSENSAQDHWFKNYWFDEGARRFRAKWAGVSA